jgi:4-hydroxybenzoate polyprenyltransferase
MLQNSARLQQILEVLLLFRIAQPFSGVCFVLNDLLVIDVDREERNVLNSLVVEHVRDDTEKAELGLKELAGA